MIIESLLKNMVQEKVKELNEMLRYAAALKIMVNVNVADSGEDDNQELEVTFNQPELETIPN